MHRISRWTLLLLSVIVALGVVTNLLFEYRDFAAQAYAVTPDGQKVVDVSSSLPEVSLAGFPRTFYVRTSVEGTPVQGTFSFFNLMINVGCWLAVALLFFAYEWYMRGKAEGKRRLALPDLLVAMSLVGCLFGYWQQLGRNQQRFEALQQAVFASGGSLERQTLLPAVIGDWIPWFATKRFETIQSIVLTSPTDDLVRQVAQAPMLQELSLRGGNYSADLINLALRNPMLCRLEVAGRPLTAENVAAFANARMRLQHLHLKRTNISVAGLNSLGETPRLVSLDLVKTGIDLAEVDLLKLKGTVRTLRLPHPDPGESSVCTLSSWNSLREVVCIEDDVLKNSTAMQLRLIDLPRLQSVQLDCLQLFALEISNAPELERIVSLGSQVGTRVGSLREAPRDLWISRLDLDGIPKLSALDVYACDLQSLTIGNSPSLQLNLNTINQDLSTAEYSVPLDVRQAWIDQIPTNELGGVGLYEMDLLGLDFSSWNQVGGVERLVIDGCRLEDELLTLKAAPRLKHITLERFPVTPDLHSHLLTSLPGLTECCVNDVTVTELRVKDHSLLSRVFINGAYPLQPSLRSVRLENLPQLSDTIDLSPGVLDCKLVNLPSLRGVSFRAPLQPAAQLGGFRSLEYFSGGGPIVDEVLVREITACKPLRRLNLAYSTAPESALMTIEQATELEELMLYGCDVSDEFVTRVIPRLSKLRKLDLSYTRISRDSLPVILNNLKLESLSVSGTGAVSGDWELLTTRNLMLQTLGVGGAHLDIELATNIGKLDQLTELDLTGCTLRQDALEHLEQTVSDTLTRLVARDVQGKVSLNNLATNVGYIDITGAMIDSRSIDWIVANCYVDMDAPPTQTLAALYEGMNNYAGSDTAGLPEKGGIDPELFDPEIPKSMLASVEQQGYMEMFRLRTSGLGKFSSLYADADVYSYSGSYSVTYGGASYGGESYGGGSFGYGGGSYGPSFFFSPWEWVGYQLGEVLKPRRTLEEF